MFPVEEKIGEIRRSLAANRSVVLTAPPGSGKTTCVPPAMLNEPWLRGKKIVMLEPRRLAARNCATYIASKMGEAVGGTVGYQVRLERKISRSTRLEIVTEGLLSQRLLSDPELSDVGLVIFDEFHERSLQCDIAFAMALEVRRALRPDLRLLVMSATLDATEVATHLGDADMIHAEGRMFPVETRYLGDISMTAAINKALAETDGDILCFLPGEKEIRAVSSFERSNDQTIKRLKDQTIKRSNDQTIKRSNDQTIKRSNEPLVLPLYGSLPKEEQDRIFAPSERRKVILSTSIAETSVTIQGITCVIDSGLMRRSRFTPSTGMSGLVTLPLTRDRAEQRRGRAGRVRPGVCYRLWTEAEERNRAERQTPEILEADLCSLVLSSVAWGATTRDGLPWLTPPAASAWDQSVELLKELGALDASCRLTAKGEAMAKLPMHPRLANMVLFGSTVGRFDGLSVEDSLNNQTVKPSNCQTAALLAAIIEEGAKTRETDIRRILDEVRETPNKPFSRRIIQLAKRVGSLQFAVGSSKTSTYPNQTANSKLQTPNYSEGALLALAYPDRIAKNRGNGTFRMVSGRGAMLEREDALAKSPFIVCCELDDRLGDAKVFLCAPIEKDEIEELFGDRIESETICEWDRQNDRVKSVIRRRLGQMTISEGQGPRGEGQGPRGEGQGPRAKGQDEQTANCMLQGIRIKGVENMPCWTKEALQLRARINFLHRHCDWPEATDDAILATLDGFVDGMTKWRDLEKLDMKIVLGAFLTANGHDRRELERLAPERMEVPTGSHMVIHYEGDEPTVEVRLQECFGLMQTPKVADGKIPIVMTLLSPAHRPIQITKDLAGFWREGYQLVRKDMRGRYPKHYWPEDPLTATPTRKCRV